MRKETGCIRVDFGTLKCFSFSLFTQNNTLEEMEFANINMKHGGWS